MMQFIIDPIMTYQEQISLRYRVLSDLGITKVDRALDELLKIVKKICDGQRSSVSAGRVAILLGETR